MNHSDEIFEGVWLGNRKAERELQEHTGAPVDVVITALTADDLIEYGIGSTSPRWIWLALDDAMEERIIDHFLHVIHEIESARKQKKRLLVHCAAGMSRSATLLIAYTMWKLGLTRKQAFEYVSKRRPIIDPNDGFMEQLYEFEVLLKRVKEMSGRLVFSDMTTSAAKLGSIV